MSAHLWVAIQYTPIIIEVEPDGSLHTSTEPVADEVAREDSVLGCMLCNEALSLDTYYTECSGAKNINGDLDIE